MLPFNIASYAALIHLVAKMTGLKPGHLVFTGGNTHIYMNHIKQCEEILQRNPLELCELKIETPDKFGEWETYSQLAWVNNFAKIDNFKLVNYKSHSAIKGKMAI